MDLDPATTQQVLDEGILGPNGRQVYGYHNGKCMNFNQTVLGGTMDILCLEMKFLQQF